MRSAVTYASSSPPSSHLNTLPISYQTPARHASTVRRTTPSRVLVEATQISTTQQSESDVLSPSASKSLPPSLKSIPRRTSIPIKRTLSSHKLDDTPEEVESSKKRRKKNGETSSQPQRPIRMEQAEDGKWVNGNWISSQAPEKVAIKAGQLVIEAEVRFKG